MPPKPSDPARPPPRDTLDDLEAIPSSADRYTVLGELARGGLGRVFAASDDVLGRPVAIKQPLGRGAEARARFEREAKITARLQHAGVVPVYDFGVSAEGEPFFAMKMVEGRSLDELIRTRADLGERLGLVPRVLAVADAVAYAHSRGVIHRDLKPANVVVGAFGETVVIDWGLARLCPAAGTDDLPELGEAAGPDCDLAPGLTRAGHVLGTPEFMPPEQAAGQVVDERADVYAIGAILYNVLAGGPPADPAASGLEGRGLPEDLVAIVTKAMARAPGDRYPSAGALAEDLRRFLDGRLVSSHRYSPLELGKRWLRRHRIAVSLSLVLVLALIASAIAGVRGVLAERNAALAAEAETAARENALTLLQAEHSLGVDATAALAWLKRYRPTPEAAWRAQAVADEAVARGAAAHVFDFPVPAGAVAVAPHRPVMLVGGADGALVLCDLATGARTRRPGPGNVIADVAFAPGGDGFVLGDAAGDVWRGRLGDAALVRLAHLAAPIEGVTVAGDGRTAVVTDAGEVHLLGPSRTAFRLPSRPASTTFCGPTLLASDLAGNLFALGAGERRARRLGHVGPDSHLHCLADGKTLISGDLDGVIRAWDLGTGRARVLGRHDDWISAITSSPDGRLVVTGGGDDLVRVFALAGGAPVVLRGHRDILRGAVFSRDGAVLATASFDSTVRLWDVASWQLLRELRAPVSGTNELFLTHDGRHLVASGRSEARVWPLAAPGVRAFAGHTGPVTHFAWSDDARVLASASRDGTMRTFELATGKSWVSPRFESWTMYVRYLAPDRWQLTTRLGHVREVAPRAGAIQEVARHNGYVSVLSPDRRLLAYARPDGIVVQELASGRVVKLADSPAEANDFSFTPDGRKVAVTTLRGRFGLWDTSSGRALAQHTRPPGLYEIDAAPDGKRAALLTSDNRLLLWDLDADHVRELPTDRVRGYALFFTMDAAALSYAAWDGTVRVLDLASLRTRVLRGHRAPITHVARARHGRPLVATGDRNGFVRLWDLATHKSAVVHAHPGPVDALALAPDGSQLATASEDAQIRVFDLGSVVFTAPPAPGASVAWLAGRTSVVIDDRRGLRTPP